jgi:hypothetical protein
MAPPPNPIVVPTVTYEYLFCLPSSERLWPPRSMEGLGVTVGVSYHRYFWTPVTTHKFAYDQFPPAINGWETKHPVPGTIPPLLAEEEGPPT